MLIYVIRVKPFDVLIINRIESMTSMDRTSQLVDESNEKRKKGDPQEIKEPIIRRKTVILEISSQKHFKNRYLSFVTI